MIGNYLILLTSIDISINLIHNIPNLISKSMNKRYKCYDRELVNSPQVKESKIHGLKDFTTCNAIEPVL